VRRKQYEQIEEQARRNGAGISAKDLNGYPVQTIDNVEVNALRNSYQSAFSHYMAGFIYEALGEPSLAAAGYRQAIELHPQTRMLEDALAGLEDRLAAGDDGWSDVLVAIETGFVPARVSRQFPLPIPVDGRLVLVPVSFPVLRNVDPGNWLPNVRIDDDIVSPVAITSVDAMARRALKDEMPGIMLRAFVRSTAKAIVQYQAQREADLRRRRRGEDAAGVLLDVASIALMIGAVATESADERSWRSLPANIWMARAKLRRGPHRISVPTDAGERSAGFAVSGRYGFIALRVVGNQLFAATSIPALEPVDRPGGRTHALPAAPR
jgi:hypothetical protein